MNSAETTYSLPGIDHKVVVNSDGKIELYDLTEWASEGIERFIGHTQTTGLPANVAISLAKACLLANGFSVEWSAGKISQISDDAEGKTCFIFSTDTIACNGELRGEWQPFDILSMLYW